MYICKYCGKQLEKESEICPACGGSSFETRADLGEVVIETPPKDGYKINLENYEKPIKHANVFMIIGILIIVLPLFPMLLFMLIIFLATKEIEFIPLIMMIPEFIIGAILISVGISKRKNATKEISRVKKLAMEGVLVKNMPYKVTDTGTVINGKHYKCIQVNYKNSAGVEIPIWSETRFELNRKGALKDTVDLLIDPNDYSNYFIDYEIN